MISARPNSHLPHSRQCTARILPAIRRASAIGLSMTVTPSGTATAWRIGPMSFLAHHELLCLARAASKNAQSNTCVIATGTPHDENVNFSIFPSPEIPHGNCGRTNARVTRQHFEKVNKALRYCAALFSISPNLPRALSASVRSAA